MQKHFYASFEITYFQIAPISAISVIHTIRDRYLQNLNATVI